MRNRAIVFPEAGRVAIIEEDVGQPGPGQVLCRAKQSLVSLGTEGACLRGVCDPGTYWEEYIRYPFRPGYSMAAEVVAVGAGLTSRRPGDRVTSWAPHSEWFIAAEGQLFPIPDGVGDEEATWATLARTTQLGVRRAELELGETAVVVGLGILGQLVTQYLRLSGVRRLIVIDPVARRRELALAGGATDAIGLPVGDARDEVTRITGGAMADVVFDITGHPAVLAPASLLLRKLGRLVLLGDSPTPSRQALGPRIVGDSIAILGIRGMMYPAAATPFNQWTAAAMTSLFFDYLSSKRMNVAALVTHRVSPLEADQVYNSIARQPDSALGVLFDWSRLT